VLARLSDLVLGTEPAMRVRVAVGLLPMLVYVAWGAMHAYIARVGAMSPDAARFMIAASVLGIVAFYPLVRSGFTARLHDAGLVLPQMLFASVWAVVGYALVAPLRPAFLQVLCLIHAFGYFSLRPRQLLFTGASTIAMLLAMLGVMAAVAPPGFDVPEQTLKVMLSLLPLTLLTMMTMHHSRLRGQLSEQRAELEGAVGQVQQLVTRDALTGLVNRTQMQELLEREVLRQARSARAFCVALIDLDHFKQINDRHGHPVGDEVLCAFARAAQAGLRETDTIARWGGEEFLLLMRDTEPEPAGQVAVERLRMTIAELQPSQSVPALRFTFSAGVAQHRGGEPLAHTIAEADRALYAAKAGGRNRVVVSAWKEAPTIPRSSA
jgi:diguanylate cyclase (GGDEF)-like protein